MEFRTISMLVDAFHYIGKLEAKQKGKVHFATKSTGRTFDNSKHPSHLTPPKLDHGKKNTKKEKGNITNNALPEMV